MPAVVLGGAPIVADAADHEEGRVDFFDKASRPYLAPEARVRSAKLLRRNDLFLEPFKVPRAVLGDAERRDLIHPSPEGRFSLDDVDRLHALARGEPTAPMPKAFTGAERGQPQGADALPEPDDLVILLVGDQGENGANGKGEGESKNGKDENSKDKDKGENGKDLLGDNYISPWTTITSPHAADELPDA